MCKTKCNMKKNVYKGSSQHPFYFSLVKPYSEKNNNVQEMGCRKQNNGYLAHVTLSNDFYHILEC